MGLGVGKVYAFMIWKQFVKNNKRERKKNPQRNPSQIVMARTCVVLNKPETYLKHDAFLVSCDYVLGSFFLVHNIPTGFNTCTRMCITRRIYFRFNRNDVACTSSERKSVVRVQFY